MPVVRAVTSSVFPCSTDMQTNPVKYVYYTCGTTAPHLFVVRSVRREAGGRNVAVTSEVCDEK